MSALRVFIMVYRTESAALSASLSDVWRQEVAPLLEGLAVTHVGYRTTRSEVQPLGPGIWRALIFRCFPYADPGLVRSLLESTLLRANHHVKDACIRYGCEPGDMTYVSGAFYSRDGERFTPTGLGASPWDASKQGGGPVCGLVAHVLDSMPVRTAMLAQRLTIDIFGQVPMTPLEAATRLLRDGERVQLAEVTLTAEGRTFARGVLLRVRTEGSEDRVEPLTHPFPTGSETSRRVIAESVRIAGSDGQPGPGAIWLRIVRPLVDHEPQSVLGSLAMAVDWGTTVAPPATAREWLYPSLDISLHLSRQPRSDWWLLDGESALAGNGTGIANLRLGDLQGMFGSAHQGFILMRRPGGGAR